MSKFIRQPQRVRFAKEPQVDHYREDLMFKMRVALRTLETPVCEEEKPALRTLFNEAREAYNARYEPKILPLEEHFA